MVIGLCGVVIPLLPGLALIWAVALGYGFIVGFGTIGVVVMAILTAALIASIIKGVLVPRKVAADSGASGRAQLGGLIGAVVGFFVIPVIGLIIGALVGVLAVEYLVKGDWDQAKVATVGTAKGFGLSVLIDLVIGFAMIVTWSLWAVVVVF